MKTFAAFLFTAIIIALCSLIANQPVHVKPFNLSRIHTDKATLQAKSASHGRTWFVEQVL